MSGFVKLYGTILTSSIWLEDHVTLRVWIGMLALADKNGEVGASIGGLAHACRVERDECAAALETLMSPDPDSRTKHFGGRRIEKIDGGWRILNYQLYREQRATDDDGTCYVYYAVAGDEVKIGTSKNPWARAKELSTARPGIRIAAVERGGRDLESDRHLMFRSYHLDGEWFAFSSVIEEHIAKLAEEAPKGSSRKARHPLRSATPSHDVVGDVSDVELPEAEAKADTEKEPSTTARAIKIETVLEELGVGGAETWHRLLDGMTQGLGTPGMKAVSVRTMLEAASELRATGFDVTPHVFKTFVAKVMERNGRVTDVTGKRGAVRNGHMTAALKMIRRVRDIESKQFPGVPDGAWREKFTEQEQEFLLLFGLKRIITDTNQGTLVAQLARALEEAGL